MADKKLHSNEIEAANRAEATAILIRAGYRVYRPEADVYGEDLVIRTPEPEGELRPVQMKGRPLVHWSLYGGRDLWMLFPDPGSATPGRAWFFIRHDELFEWFQERHGGAPGWAERHEKGQPEWSQGSLGEKLAKFLEPFTLRNRPV